MKNEPLIVWEKWRDPFGSDEDKSDILSNDDPWNSYNNESDDTKPDIKKARVIVTPMGLVPFMDSTDASKIFKFWLGHTNFNISSNIVSVLENIEGIETLDIFTRYRFRIAIGKSFNDRDVMNNINTTIYTYIKDKNL